MDANPLDFTYDFDICKSMDPEEVESGLWIVEGMAATTGLDDQNDVIDKAALLSAANDLTIRSTVLFNHDDDEPIGKVLKSTAEDKGIRVKVQISKTEEKKWIKIQEGIINKFSIRGRVVSAKQEPYQNGQSGSFRRITKMRLLEVSLVSVPANAEAETLDVYVSKRLTFQEPDSKGDEPVSSKENDPIVKSDVDSGGEVAKVTPETLLSSVEKAFEAEPIEDQESPIVEKSNIDSLDLELEDTPVEKSEDLASNRVFLLESISKASDVKLLLEILEDKRPEVFSGLKKSISEKLETIEKGIEVVGEDEFKAKVQSKVLLTKCLYEINTVAIPSKTDKEATVLSQISGLIKSMLADDNFAKAAESVDKPMEEDLLLLYLQQIETLVGKSEGEARGILESISSFLSEVVVRKSIKTSATKALNPRLEKALSKLEKLEEKLASATNVFSGQTSSFEKKSLDGQANAEEKPVSLFAGLFDGIEKFKKNHL